VCTDKESSEITYLYEHTVTSNTANDTHLSEHKQLGNFVAVSYGTLVYFIIFEW